MVPTTFSCAGGCAVNRGLQTAAPQPAAANAYTVPVPPPKSLLAKYTTPLLTVGPTCCTIWSIGALCHSGGQIGVVDAQPVAANANSPSLEVAYTVPLSTAG